jgi:pyruvate dehydrogenase E1 component alpha subunit
MHISLRQPLDATSRFAAAHDIPFELVDGNDVVAVQQATRRLVDRSRDGGGPGFLEAVTARWYGHVDWREDIDVGVNRSTVDLENWRRRDPIGRLAAGLKAAGVWTDQQHEDLEAGLRRHIEAAWAQAMQDPYPPASALLDRVYAPGTAA